MADSGAKADDTSGRIPAYFGGNTLNPKPYRPYIDHSGFGFRGLLFALRDCGLQGSRPM